MSNTPHIKGKLTEVVPQLLTLLENGYVLQEPSGHSLQDNCELTLPANMAVQYTTGRMYYHMLMVLIEKAKTEKLEPYFQTERLRRIRHANIKEPECAASWGIVNIENHSALRFEMTEDLTYNDLIDRVNRPADDPEDQDDELEPEKDSMDFHKLAVALVNAVMQGKEESD